MEDKTIKIVAVGIIALLVVAGTAYLLWPDDDDGDEITLAFGYSSGYQPMIYAWKAGLFEAEGVNVKVNLVASSGPSVAALLSGDADMSFNSPDPVFSALNDGALKVQMLCNSRLPGMSSMHTLYNTTTINATDLVKQMSGDDEVPSEKGLINFANTVVNLDGTIRGKIALHVASSYEGAWLGFIELLYKGGTVYGVEYPEKQITQEQYATLTNTHNGNMYIRCDSYGTVGTNVLRGDALIGIGSNAGMSSSASEGNAENPGRWAIMSTPSLIDSGFATILASQKAIDNKYDQIVKVLRAIDKASALMADPSTARMVAEVCAPFLYSGSDKPISVNVAAELAYYKEVRWDICRIANTPTVFENIANISGYNQDGQMLTKFSTIYNEDFIGELMDKVHQGGSWDRNALWEYVN